MRALSILWNKFKSLGDVGEWRKAGPRNVPNPGDAHDADLAQHQHEAGLASCAPDHFIKRAFRKWQSGAASGHRLQAPVEAGLEAHDVALLRDPAFGCATARHSSEIRCRYDSIVSISASNPLNSAFG